MRIPGNCGQTINYYDTSQCIWRLNIMHPISYEIKRRITQASTAFGRTNC